LSATSPRADGRPGPTRLFRNEGGGAWLPFPEAGLDQEVSVGSAASGHPHGCLEVFDADADGWLDVLVCARDPALSPTVGVQVLTPRLFRNQAGAGFVEVPDAGGLGPRMNDAAPVDLDRDGDTDLVAIDDDRAMMFQQTAAGFSLVAEWPFAFGLRVAVADTQRDGAPDLYQMRRRLGQESGLTSPQRTALRALHAPGARGDVLLLDDGSGAGFVPHDVPYPAGGVPSADDVVPLDHEGDGRVELLVLNGGSDEVGRVQLIDVS
jgi:hypothetical protein